MKMWVCSSQELRSVYFVQTSEQIWENKAELENGAILLLLVLQNLLSIRKAKPLFYLTFSLEKNSKFCNSRDWIFWTKPWS